MYVSVADDGSLNCWRNETGRTRDASDHFDCANLLPLISPQACDARTGPCANAPHPEAPCANAPCDAPCANAPCEAPCDAPRNATRHAPACTARRIASSQLLLSSSIHLPWQLSLLSDAAANIAAALLADWFRMDLFLGHPQLELRVNEITYPSHILDTGPLQQRLTPTPTATRNPRPVTKR